VKIAAVCWLLVGLLSLPRQSATQASADSIRTEAALYSLYTKRVVNTAAFADLAVTGAADANVRKAAQNLARDHREAQEKTERLAHDRKFTIAPPEHDTSDVLLAQARSALKEKTGRAVDSAWVTLAHQWLLTLMLDNNRNVKPRLAGQLQPVAVDHTTWLFHQLADIDKLAKKFK